MKPFVIVIYKDVLYKKGSISYERWLIYIPCICTHTHYQLSTKAELSSLLISSSTTLGHRGTHQYRLPQLQLLTSPVVPQWGHSHDFCFTLINQKKNLHPLALWVSSATAVHTNYCLVILKQNGVWCHSN